MQAEGCQHETSDRAERSGREIVMLVQVVPFQVMAWSLPKPICCALAKDGPTATQRLALVHDRPDRLLPGGPGGTFRSVQVAPSQLKAKLASEVLPTATHKDVVGHDTPSKSLSGPPGGTASTCHVLPFHPKASFSSVCSGPSV